MGIKHIFIINPMFLNIVFGMITAIYMPLTRKKSTKVISFKILDGS